MKACEVGRTSRSRLARRCHLRARDAAHADACRWAWKCVVCVMAAALKVFCHQHLLWPAIHGPRTTICTTHQTPATRSATLVPHHPARPAPMPHPLETTPARNRRQNTPPPRNASLPPTQPHDTHPSAPHPTACTPSSTYSIPHSPPHTPRHAHLHQCCWIHPGGQTPQCSCRCPSPQQPLAWPPPRWQSHLQKCDEMNRSHTESE